MIKKFVDLFINFFITKSNKRSWFVSIIIFLSIIAPLVITDYLNYDASKKYLTELTLSRRESLAHLAATLLREKFDRIVDVGVSFATRVQFRKLIEEGKWNEAIKILASAPKDFSYIDSVALFDPQGTVWAVTPPIPEVIGQNFAYRDYYKGVSKDWQPYLSEMFKRAVEPKYNVISMAIPIKSDAIQGSNQKIIGILLLTINLDTVLDLAQEIDPGNGGFTYFIDRAGHAAGHPKYSSRSDIFNFSEVPAVQKVLRGEKGVEILFNQVEGEERISAYEQVPGYGWGVIIQQPTLIAFASRNANLGNLLIADVVTLLISCIMVYFIIFFIRTLNRYRQKENIVLASLGDGLVAIDRWWNITLFNSAAERLSGWSASDVVGKPLRQFIKFVREKNRTENIVFIEEAMLNGHTGFMENNTLLIQKDGHEVPVGDSAAPIFDNSGKVDGAIIVFRDISKEREMNSLRSDFAYASHQLRTPVTKALWSLEGALDTKGTQEMREKIELAYTAMQSVNKLMGQILEVSNIDQLRVRPKISEVSLDVVLTAVRNTFTLLIKKRRVSISLTETNLKIQSDAALLKRILVEIFDNAIQYSPRGSAIEVVVKKEDDGIIISVNNKGVGISDSQQALIFTKFFRGENIDATNIIGAGLGLFIARAYTNLLGGKIWFTSKVNEETTFFVHIPSKNKGNGEK